MALFLEYTLQIAQRYLTNKSLKERYVTWEENLFYYGQTTLLAYKFVSLAAMNTRPV